MPACWSRLDLSATGRSASSVGPWKSRASPRSRCSSGRSPMWLVVCRCRVCSSRRTSWAAPSARPGIGNGSARSSTPPCGCWSKPRRRRHTVSCEHSAARRTTKGPDMPAPSLIVFDVNETLSDLEPMAQRFTDIGLPAQLATTWFAQVLRDGFALTSPDRRSRARANLRRRDPGNSARTGRARHHRTPGTRGLRRCTVLGFGGFPAGAAGSRRRRGRTPDPVSTPSAATLTNTGDNG